MKGESVRLRLFEAIQDCGRLGGSLEPRKVKRLSVSAERWKVGRVRGEKFGADDLQ
jgi:hypothetical protein